MANAYLKVWVCETADNVYNSSFRKYSQFIRHSQLLYNYVSYSHVSETGFLFNKLFSTWTDFKSCVNISTAICHTSKQYYLWHIITVRCFRCPHFVQNTGQVFFPVQYIYPMKCQQSQDEYLDLHTYVVLTS